MFRFARQTALVAAAALLASCKAAPMVYLPTSFPFYTADAARRFVHETLTHWRIEQNTAPNRAAAHGPITAVAVRIDRIALIDKHGRKTDVMLDELGIVDIANRTITIGEVTLAAGPHSTDVEARRLADTLLYLKSIAPYEPLVAITP